MDVAKMFKSGEFIFNCVAITLIKLLLLPSYKSTDFEVHRNWLAITSNLPLSKWYTEATSIWTLDYPPFFAYFELFLAQFAPFFDAEMLVISKDAFSSNNTVLFQRLTVIVSDFVYYYACYCWFVHLRRDERLKIFEPTDPMYKFSYVFSVVCLWLPSLLLVDHVHFQYNGFLNGILLLSILKITEDKILQASVLFVILLNLKHLYIYLAPVYFVYILRRYCLTPDLSIRFKNCFKLGYTILSIFAISLGPFIWNGQSKQLIARLFPVKRGLTHAYWAPNFWSIYNCMDKAASVLKLRSRSHHSRASMTGGLVQEFKHQNLPSINFATCAIFVVLTMLPALQMLWNRALDKRKADLKFIQCLVLIAFSSFLFGWHVHEKAIMMIVIPMIPLAFYSKRISKHFFILNTVASYSIFPLLIEQAETPTKVLLLLIYSFYVFGALSNFHRNVRRSFKLLNLFETAYLVGLIFVQIYSSFSTTLFSGLHNRLPFLHLLLTSIYCALGVFFTWLRMYNQLLFES